MSKKKSFDKSGKMWLIIIGILFVAIFYTKSGSSLPIYFAQSIESPGKHSGGSLPELLVQDGHTQKITCLAFSPDGKTVITGSDDETAKIWDVSSGKVLATLSGHRWEEDTIVYSSPVTCLAFSPDGKTVATGSKDLTIRLWNVASAQTQKILKGHTGEIKSLIFTQDGKTLISGSLDNSVRFWDVLTGKEIDTKITSEREDAAALALSPDGKTLAVGWHETARIYELPSKKAKFNLRHNCDIVSLTFSPDGTVLATGEGTSSKMIKLWDAGTGLLIATMEHEPDDHLTDLKFSPNGQLLSLSYKNIYIWNAKSGKLINKIKSDDMQSKMAISPDGQKIAVGDCNRSSRIYTVSSGKELVKLKGRASNVINFAFNKNNTLFATGSMDGTVTIWDLASGKIVADFPGDASVFSLVFSYDGYKLAAGYRTGILKIWDVREKKLIFERKSHDEEVDCLAFSPDGRTLVSGGGDKKVILLDLESKKIRATFKHPSNVTSVSISPDAKMLATACMDGKIRQWDIDQRNVVIERSPSLNSTYQRAWSVAISPNGRTIAGGFEDGTVKIWDMGLEEMNFDLNTECRRPIYSISFSPEGNILAAGMDLRTMLWDTSSGKELARFEGDGMVTICAGEKVIATGSPFGTIRFWKIPSCELLATAAVLDEGKNWAVITPKGLFDGSPDGMKIIEWRIKDNVYSLDQFFDEFYTPGLLSRVLATASSGTPTPLLPQVTRDISELKPPPKITIISPKSNTRLNKSNVTVEVKLLDQKGGSSNPGLYLNGHRIPNNNMKKSGEGRFLFQVDLVKGLNRLRATAFNGDGSVESKSDEIGVICESSSSRKSSLFLLAVGIDNYQSGMKLRFAIKDAKAISGFFKPGLYSDVKSSCLIDRDAGKDAILKSLRRIAGEAQSQDLVIVYLAGHGTSIGDMFYYIPYDAKVGSEVQIQSTGISSLELGQALSNIAATRQVIIIDACHSGASTTALGRLLLQSGLIRSQQRMARTSGTFLIAASKDNQYAIEIPELGHGVLTYSILTALGDKNKPAAFTNKSGEVTVNALLQYVSSEVPKLSQRFHGISQDVVQFSTGQDFPLVVRR